MKELLEIMLKAEEAKVKVMKEALANITDKKEMNLEVFTEAVEETEAEVKEVEAVGKVMPKPTKKTRAKKNKKDATEKSFEDMTAKELIAVCEEHGIKVLKAGRNKKYYLDKLAEAGVVESKETEKEETKEDKEESVKEEVVEAETAVENDDDGDDWDIEEEEVKDLYANKTAKELFTLCKERGLVVKPRQSAEVYKNMLIEDDNKKEDTVDDTDDWRFDDDDDWEI